MTDQNYIYHETEGRPIKAWTKGVPVEDSAMEQLRNVASLPIVHQLKPRAVCLKLRSNAAVSSTPPWARTAKAMRRAEL